MAKVHFGKTSGHVMCDYAAKRRQLHKHITDKISQTTCLACLHSMIILNESRITPQARTQYQRAWGNDHPHPARP